MDTTTLFLILISIAIGIIIGLLISSLKKSPPDKKSPPLPASKRPAAGGPDPRPASPRSGPRPAASQPAPRPAPRPETTSPPSAPDTAQASPPDQQEEENLTGSRSIVEQVDEILQEKLANSPLNEKGIFLQEDPQKGMIIWVGLKSYEDIGEIPDSSIREIIRSAVRAWESKTSVE
ncbi:MAG: hypothetical protein MAG431_00949 [Chloroflexi bacterium]|nr:hypothetical protein [Chloroflexota bacterium]